MPRSALIVAVPEAEPAVGEWRERYDNARLGIPAHITLLFPFVPAAELDEGLFAELRELFAAEPPITFILARVVTFPDETIWLSPEPSEPFRTLTELIVEHYPEYPPYEGVHDEVIPHLTVTSGDASLRNDVEAAISPHLPIAAETHEVVLLEEDDTELWRARECFPLRG